jgi:hypothetical protein
VEVVAMTMWPLVVNVALVAVGLMWRFERRRQKTHPGTGFGDPYETRADSPAARDPWGSGGSGG